MSGVNRSQLFRNTVKELSNRSRSNLPSFVVEGVLFLIFALVEEFLVEENFRCPCVEDPQCVPSQSYGVGFMVISTTAVMFFSFFTIATVKCKCRKSEQFCSVCAHGCQCRDFWFWMCQAFVAALAWLTVLLIDGDYVACASTCDAYGNTTCNVIDQTPANSLSFSKSYKDGKRISQYIGFGVGASTAAIYGLLKACDFSHKCCQKSCCQGTCLRCKCELDEDLRIPNTNKFHREYLKTLLNDQKELFERAGMQEKILEAAENIYTQIKRMEQEAHDDTISQV